MKKFIQLGIIGLGVGTVLATVSWWFVLLAVSIGFFYDELNEINL